jgi:hypothetical protein
LGLQFDVIRWWYRFVGSQPLVDFELGSYLHINLKVSGQIR